MNEITSGCDSTDPLKAQINEKQAIKYAEDLIRIYKRERTKCKALDITNYNLRNFMAQLNEKLDELEKKNKELRASYMETLSCLGIAAEFNDEETGEHISRMARYCAILSREIGLSRERVIEIFHASPMHDIGKIGVPGHLLRKEGKLTPEEFDQIKKHTVYGAKILSGSKAPIINVAKKTAVSHHERWNGKGYPAGLSKDQIPLEGRIVALADVFDALMSPRPYKEAYPLEITVEIIRKEREEMFDPLIVDAFLNCLDDFFKIRKSIGDDIQNGSSVFSWSERDQDCFMNRTLSVGEKGKQV